MIQSTYQTISGMGTFQVSPGCAIQVPPDTNIRSEYMIGQEFLSGDTIMGTVNQLENISIIIPQHHEIFTSTFKPLTLTDISSFRQGIELIFNHKQTFTEVVRVIAYLLNIFFLIFSLAMCFKPIRLYIKTLTLSLRDERSLSKAMTKTQSNLTYNPFAKA